MTGAAVLGVGEGVPPMATFHAHKSGDKAVRGRLTSAGTSWCYAEESPHLRLRLLRRPTQFRLFREACLVDLTACLQSTEEAEW